VVGGRPGWRAGQGSCHVVTFGDVIGDLRRDSHPPLLPTSPPWSGGPPVVLQALPFHIPPTHVVPIPCPWRNFLFCRSWELPILIPPLHEFPPIPLIPSHPYPWVPFDPPHPSSPHTLPRNPTPLDSHVLPPIPHTWSLSLPPLPGARSSSHIPSPRSPARSLPHSWVPFPVGLLDAHCSLPLPIPCPVSRCRLPYPAYP